MPVSPPRHLDIHLANTCTVHTTIRALVKFDISNNDLYAAGGKAIAEGLKNNHIMTELNLADNSLGKVGTRYDAAADMSGVIAISNAIPTMGALASLDLSQNGISESESSRINTVCKAKSISLKV